MAVSVLVSMLWLPPLPVAMPPKFFGAYATNSGACRSAAAGTQINVRQSEIEFAGRRDVREMIVLDNDTILVRLSDAVVGERRSGTSIEPPLPVGEPRNLIVLKRDGPDRLRVKTSDFELVAMRCERV